MLLFSGRGNPEGKTPGHTVRAAAGKLDLLAYHRGRGRGLHRSAGYPLPPPPLHPTLARVMLYNGGPMFLGLFFLFVGSFFFCFSLVFPRKTAVSLCFGRIWRDFPWFSYEKNMFFAFPWFFLGKTAVSLCFGRIWRDFPWFSYEKTYSCP